MGITRCESLKLARPASSMGAASIHIDRVGLVWRNLWSKVAARKSSNRGCPHLRNIWRRLRGEMPGVFLDGLRYCPEECLEPVLFDAFERTRSTPKPAAVQHRIPLGLLLVSRQQLTAEQLWTALAAQRSAGRGRLGEWLLALGFVTEDKVTAALARQWRCPVLRANSSLPRISRPLQLPLTMLEGFAMIPVDYVEATSTLHVAFADGVDHNVLYAIEKMTGSHTEPCMAGTGFVRANLRNLFRQRSENEVSFECAADISECCRIVRSYTVRLSASEIRLAGCGWYVWVRLFRVSRPPMDLLFRDSRAQPLSTVCASLESASRVPMAVAAL